MAEEVEGLEVRFGSQDPDTREFEGEWAVVVVACQMLAHTQLEKLQRTAQMAESVGPILDPSAYRAGQKNLPNQLRLLEKAIALRDTYREVIESEQEQP